MTFLIYWVLVARLISGLREEDLRSPGSGLWSLGWVDPLEEGMVTHSSILAWEIPWTEEPGGLQSMGWQRVVYNSAAENGWTCWCVGFPLTKGFDPLLPPGAGGREKNGLRSFVGQ